MMLHAPQLIMAGLLIFSVGVALAQHGEPKTGNHNVIMDVIGAGITFTLLWWGGFFK